MTLKKSFLGSMIQNLKRRRTISVFVFMILFFSYPVNLLLILQSAVSDRLSDAEKVESCMEAAWDIISYNSLFFWIFGVIGMVIGLQAFAYLHKRNKVDLYNSVPVSYNRRFLVILVNSIIIVIVPVLICYFFSLSLLGAYGILNSRTAGVLFITMMTGVLLCMGIFSITSLSVCLTGKTFVSGLGTVVLLVYEIGIYGLINIYMERSLKTYVSDYMLNTWSRPKFSIIYYVSEIINADGLRMYSGKKLNLFSMISESGISIGFSICMMFLITIVTLFLAYICFKKRPGEAAGKSMAFDKTKRVIKYMIVIPAALYGAELFEGVWTNDFFTFVIGLIITVVMGNMVIEVIYEGDIRSALKHLVDIPITMAVAVIWIGAFSNDVFGYDSYIPKQDSVKAVAFNGVYDDPYNMVYCVEGASGDYYSNVDSITFWMKHPFEDEKSKEVILNAVKKNITEENGERWVVVGYYLKNGQKKYRGYYLPLDDIRDIMDVVKDTKSYKEVLFNGIYEMRKEIKSIVICDESGNRTEVSEGDMDEVLDAYIKDMDNRSIKDIEENVPAGSIRLVLPSYVGYAEMLNYPFCRDFSNTISCLEKKGLYYSDYLKSRSIESVYAYNFKITEDGLFLHNDRQPDDEEHDMQSIDWGQPIYGDYRPVYNRKWLIPAEQSDVIRKIAETGKSHYLIGSTVYESLKSDDFYGADSCYAVQIQWKSASGEYNSDIFYFEEDSAKDIEDIIKLYGKEE